MSARGARSSPSSCASGHPAMSRLHRPPCGDQPERCDAGDDVDGSCGCSHEPWDAPETVLASVPAPDQLPSASRRGSATNCLTAMPAFRCWAGRHGWGAVASPAPRCRSSVRGVADLRGARRRRDRAHAPEAAPFEASHAPSSRPPRTRSSSTTGTGRRHRATQGLRSLAIRARSCCGPSTASAPAALRHEQARVICSRPG
jgi:hypothetical protein